MLSIKSLATGVLFAAAAVSAAPSRTVRQAPSGTVSLTGVTHSVVAGLGGGLVFDPDNVVAEIGDVVEWLFLPANHSVAQASFDGPCHPLEGGAGFFSGFHFATEDNLAPDVFQIVVEDSLPIWYYCGQGKHCESGMVGAINQDFSDSVHTLTNFRTAAEATESTILGIEQGGEVLCNPNPGSGF